MQKNDDFLKVYLLNYACYHFILTGFLLKLSLNYKVSLISVFVLGDLKL